MARWRPRPASRACPNRRCSTWPSPSLTRQGRTPLGAGNTRLVWSRTPLPALENLGDLHQAVAFRSIDRSRVLLNDSAPTDLEWADGNRAPAIRKLSGKLSGPSATTQSLAAAFDQHLAPSCRQPRTRADYWRAWRLVITYVGSCAQGSPAYPADVARHAEGPHVGPGVFRGAELSSRDGLEGRPSAASTVSASAACLRGQPVLGVGSDARFCARAADVAEAADPEGHNQVAACVEARDAGGSPCPSPYMCRHVSVYAGQ